MANGRTRTVNRKACPWEAYDSLPAPVRAALQEGPQGWDPVAVKTRLRAAQKALGHADGIAAMVRIINAWHAHEIKEARPWQKRVAFQKTRRLPSPHLLAQASMQLSGRIA